MISYPAGKITFRSEVTNINELGFWLLIETEDGFREYFVSFNDYPGFKQATVAQICAFEQPSLGHFYWPELDEDIEINALQNPENHPLSFKH